LGWRTIARPIATRCRWPPDNARGFHHPRIDLGSWQPALAQRKAHVVAHVHVRIERVVLEHHGDVAVLRHHVIHDPVTDGYLAVGDIFKAGDHAQQGRLAAARWPHQRHELAVCDVERDAVYDLERTVILADAPDCDCAHGPR
jgi:hypothetical protein